MTQQEKDVLAKFIKVARHARNFPHPEIPIERLRMEAVEAESFAQRVLGEKEYEKTCKTAFKEN